MVGRSILGANLPLDSIDEEWRFIPRLAAHLLGLRGENRRSSLLKCQKPGIGKVLYLPGPAHSEQSTSLIALVSAFGLLCYPCRKQAQKYSQVYKITALSSSDVPHIAIMR